MVFVVVLLSLWVLVAASTALQPRVGWLFPKYVFPVGWVAGELAGQAIVVQAALLGVLWWWGWPSSVIWRVVVLVVAATNVMANLRLVRSQFDVRRLVRRALDEHPEVPIPTNLPLRHASWWRTLVQWPLAPTNLVITGDIHYGVHRRQRLDVWRTPTTPAGAPVLLYLHGGSWTFGDKRSQARPLLYEFVAQGWVVVTANYRLAPDFPWPAQAEDTQRVLAWIRSFVANYGGDPDRIVTAGSSAGGQLAAMLALEDPTGAIRGCISFYGVLEMTGDESLWGRTGSGIRWLLEERVVQRTVAEDRAYFESMSPLHRIGPTAPPFLVLQGRNDTLVGTGVARAFVRTFATASLSPIYHVELPHAQHAFDLSASPRTSATTRAAVAFATAVTERRPTLSPELWAAYQSPPVVIMVNDGAWRSAPEVARAHGPFYVVTPDNPYSRLTANDEARAGFLRQVQRHGWRSMPSRNTDPSGEWPSEEGRALFGLDEATARALARRWGQHALYEVTGQVTRVVIA